ncbi:MAG: 50S ribosomal protein L7/L12 [Patescibacteria group bacterium]
MSKVQTIIDQLKDLSLLEASELVKAIEETFNVSAAAAPAMMMAGPVTGGDAGAAAEEKTEFTVEVSAVPADAKIAIIKVVKNLLNIGLTDAKAKVEAAPFVVAENVSKEEAEKMKAELSGAGATVNLK